MKHTSFRVDEEEWKKFLGSSQKNLGMTAAKALRQYIDSVNRNAVTVRIPKTPPAEIEIVRIIPPVGQGHEQNHTEDGTHGPPNPLAGSSEQGKTAKKPTASNEH